MFPPNFLLPDFIIIGAMKSGTTTLYRHLADHPGVTMSKAKETDFFVAEKNWTRGLAWYSSQFSPDPALKRGEASPNYTKCRDFAGVAARMAQLCPAARLIYLVRDPVVRAESQFRHAFLLGKQFPDLAVFAGSRDYDHIMDASHYARQMDVYLSHYPKDAILVVDFDLLVDQPQVMLDQITRHIGLPPHPVSNRAAQNDSAELSRVPAPILRFAQSRAGRVLADLVSRAARDQIRTMLARTPPRTAPRFPAPLLARMRDDLAPDAARFRQMTAMPFAQWSV